MSQTDCATPTPPRPLAPDEIEVLARCLFADQPCPLAPGLLSEQGLEALAERLCELQGPRPLGTRSEAADGYFASPRCKTPVPFAPGSPEKQAELAERRRRWVSVDCEADEGHDSPAIYLGYAKLLASVGYCADCLLKLRKNPERDGFCVDCFRALREGPDIERLCLACSQKLRCRRCRRVSPEVRELALYLLNRIGGEYGREHATRRGA